MDVLSSPVRFDAGVRNAYVTDAADLESSLGSGTECIQLSSGVFAARACEARLGALRVIAQAANRRLEIRQNVPADKLAIAYLDSADRVLEHGRLLPPHHMLLVNAKEIDLSVPAGAQLRWIEIDLSLCSPLLQSELARIAGNQTLVLPGDSAAALQLRSYVDLVLQMSADEPVRFHSDMLCGRIETDLLLRIDRVFHTPAAAVNGLARERKAFALVRAVERFMWDHVDEPLTLQRICEHTGCRMRSLIYSFKDAFGVGPITYLKILRLNAAHRRLRNSHGNVRIFDVAAALGFWHMGHFSADYKRLFGVTASETVGRTPMPRFRSRIAQRP